MGLDQEVAFYGGQYARIMIVGLYFRS
jgi:multidrug resistance protein, MATE family